MREYPKLPPRLRWIFAPNPVFFVTFCTYQRRKLLAADSVNSAFVAFARHAHTRNIAVGRYVIMPDHLHLFVCGPDDFELGRWIGVLKKTSQSKSSIQERNRQSGSGGFSILFCAAMKATRKNGITSGRIQFARDWSETQTTGRIPGRSS